MQRIRRNFNNHTKTTVLPMIFSVLRSFCYMGGMRNERIA